MIRYLFLTMFSFASLVEGSFRSQADHEASERSARAHPGFGAAVLVCQYGRDFREVSIFNGTYIAPGKVLTHSHERMEIGKIFVVSRFAGFQAFSCDVDMNIERDSFSYTIKYNLNELDKNHCRKVRSIAFPEGRNEVDYSPVIRELNPNDPQSLEFVANYEGYVRDVLSYPVPIIRSEDRALVGSDFCVLDIKPFKEDHPTAKFYSAVARETGERSRVTVLGCSFYTHVCDGSDYLLQNVLSGIYRNFKAQGLTKAYFNLRICPRATCFSQSVRQIGDWLVGEAVCGLTTTRTAFVPGNEIFDPQRTNSDIQALIVQGLSGSGIYVGDKLIGLVSHAHKCFLTEIIERVCGSSQLAGDAARVMALTPMHPSVMPHPLLNIHQIVTEESIAPLLADASAR